MEQIAVSRSIVSDEAFGRVIQKEFDLGEPFSCKLISKMLRTQDNDHYLIKIGDEKYVARIYQLGTHLGREESDYLFELDWLQFLREKGGAVSYPIPRSDGSLLGAVNAPEGIRYYALFSFAQGKPFSANNEEHLFTLGRHMAEIHLLSNDYKGGFNRQPMDLTFLVDQPIQRLKDFWGSKKNHKLDILLNSAEEARVAIQALLDNEETTDDSWGPIGGDFHPYNTHIDLNGQPTFFSFDLCGYGWRAYDIAVFLLNADLIHVDSIYSEAFFAGYYSVRPLSSNEHEAISPFLNIRRVWLAGTFSTVDRIAGYSFIGPAQLEI